MQSTLIDTTDPAYLWINNPDALKNQDRVASPDGALTLFRHANEIYSAQGITPKGLNLNYLVFGPNHSPESVLSSIKRDSDTSLTEALVEKGQNGDPYTTLSNLFDHLTAHRRRTFGHMGSLKENEMTVMALASRKQLRTLPYGNRPAFMQAAPELADTTLAGYLTIRPWHEQDSLLQPNYNYLPRENWHPYLTNYLEGPNAIPGLSLQDILKVGIERIYQIAKVGTVGYAGGLGVAQQEIRLAEMLTRLENINTLTLMYVRAGKMTEYSLDPSLRTPVDPRDHVAPVYAKSGYAVMHSNGLPLFLPNGTAEVAPDGPIMYGNTNYGNILMGSVRTTLFS